MGRIEEILRKGYEKARELCQDGKGYYHAHQQASHRLNEQNEARNAILIAAYFGETAQGTPVNPRDIFLASHHFNQHSSEKIRLRHLVTQSGVPVLTRKSYKEMACAWRAEDQRYDGELSQKSYQKIVSDYAELGFFEKRDLMAKQRRKDPDSERLA